MSREDRGFIYLGRYIYAKKLKRGGYSMYEGMYSDRAEDRTSGIEVMRNADNKPFHFLTLEDAEQYYKQRYC